MCNSPTCPGDDNASSKEACRACYGVTYRDPEERKEEWLAMKRSEKIESACKRIAIAVRDLEQVTGTKLNREQLYRSLETEGDFEAAKTLAIMLGDGMHWKPSFNREFL